MGIGYRDIEKSNFTIYIFNLPSSNCRVIILGHYSSRVYLEESVAKVSPIRVITRLPEVIEILSKSCSLTNSRLNAMQNKGLK